MKAVLAILLVALLATAAGKWVWQENGAQALSATVAQFNSANDVKPGCVRAYEHCNYQGAVQEYCGDIAYVGAGMNDKISALKIGAGSTVTVFEHASYQGRSKTYTADVACLIGDQFNDITSSIKASVKQGCAAFYEHCNYEGRFKVNCGDNAWVGQEANDLISAVKVGPKTKVTLFEHVNFQGRNRDVTADIACFVGLTFKSSQGNFNDLISSYKITVLPDVCFNQDNTVY